MSDPIANAEIEDVLSSIRRLVSAEERGERTGRARRDDHERPDARLVLTPAHRIDDDRIDEAPDAVPSDAPDGVEIELPETAEAVRAHDFDGIEDAEIVEGGEPADSSGPGGSAGLAGEDPTDTVQAGTDGGDGDDEVVARFMRHTTSKSDIPDAAMDEAAGMPSDTAEPEPGDAPMVVDGLDETDGEGAEITQAAGNAAEAPDPAVGLEEIGARIAEFESVLAGQPGEWEPDGTPDDGDNAADPVSPLPWEELEADTSGPNGDDAGGSGAGATEGRTGAGGWYSEEALIDEDALRDLIGEIVRQELQGALGERITRNVRKLVRREIHRALMSQGLDD